MSLSDKFRKEDSDKYYRSVDKLPLSTWFDIISYAESGYPHKNTIRLIKSYGLNLCAEDGRKLNASIEEIEESLIEENRLHKSDKTADKAFTLVSLGGYTLDTVYVKQCEVAKAYGMAGETVFPWQKFMGKVENKDGIVWLNCNDTKELGEKEKTKSVTETAGDFIERQKRKQKMPQEPHGLSVRYRGDKSNQQLNWDSIPDVRPAYWKHRDTITILELAFIIKGKEPQPKATQRNVLELYPLEFCEFFADLLTLADSSFKACALTEIDPPNDYLNDEDYTPDFERSQLIKWAVSKEIGVPDWLKAGVDAGTVSQTKTPRRVKDKNRTRKTNLSRAIYAAIEVIGKKPSLDELWKYFEDGKDETGFIEDNTDIDITWLDTKGKLHDTKKESIANLLSRIKS
jgi:hypothetical protein